MYIFDLYCNACRDIIMCNELFSDEYISMNSVILFLHLLQYWQEVVYVTYWIIVGHIFSHNCCCGNALTIGTSTIHNSHYLNSIQ